MRGSERESEREREREREREGERERERGGVGAIQREQEIGKCSKRVYISFQFW